MLLQPIPTATLAAGRSSGEAPFPFRRRCRRHMLLPIRADSTPISLSASAPSRPAKPAACTADELHYAPVDGAGWRLALWRYRPPRNVCVLRFGSVRFRFFVAAKMVFDLIWRCLRAGSRQESSADAAVGSRDQRRRIRPVTRGKLGVPLVISFESN